MRRTNKKQVTLSDIARAGGVSLSAVSLSLNAKPGVSEETRARVIELARTLGYHMKAANAPGSTIAIKTIGLLVCTNIVETAPFTTFHTYIASALHSTCQQMDLNLECACVELDRDFHPLSIPPLLETGAVDGFLIAGMPVGAEICQVLDRRGLPVVLLEAYCQERDYSAILYDNFHGGYDAAMYLAGKGHRHIGYVGGHKLDFPCFRERRAGYHAALAKRQLTPYWADFPVYLAQREAVIAAALALLRGSPQITALVCATDDIAMAAIGGMEQAGICVPRDVSVIGFDDVEMAGNAHPPLTTMQVSKQSMGRIAVQILLNQALNEGRECVMSYFRPVVVERDTVRNIGTNPNESSNLG